METRTQGRAAPLITFFLALAAACGGASSEGGLHPSGAEAPSVAGVVVEGLALANQRARDGAVTDTLHGVQVADPYRSLEEDTPETQAWIGEQTTHAENYFNAHADPSATARVAELLSIGTIGGVKMGGRSVFFTKRDGDREQPLLMVHEGESARPLVDPTTFGERAALDWYYPSPAGTYIAFGISQNGDERSTLRVMRVADGELLGEEIARTKWSTVTWMHAEDAFYYTRYPKPGEADFDSENEDSYFPRVFFHTLGAEETEDVLVFSGENPTDFPGASVSDDDRWLVINVFRGWSESDVYLFDRGRGRMVQSAPSEARPLVTVVAGESHITTGEVHRGQLYLTTNHDSPRYRIDKVAAARATDASARRILIAEGEGAIEDWTFSGSRIVVHYMEDVQSQVRVFSLSGAASGQIDLEGFGEVGGVNGSPEHQMLAFDYSAYTIAPTLYVHERGNLRAIDQIDAGIDLSRFAVTRQRISSTDGTDIPVTLIHAASDGGVARTGQQPVLLYGYGGFNVSLLPSFTRNALYWIERGGVYAIANLRGGGEFGEDWHQAGSLGNKENVFQDFESVIRWLSSSGISNPDRIGITGGSNGGLLMGAMLTRCPDAFKATASYVGLYDMVRYHQFPPAELWISEYGSADDPEQFRWLHAYSPYHRVAPGIEYPSVLIETADHDSRVFWGHSTKFAARLQENNTSTNPILFFMERSVGHGAGTSRTDLVRRYVRQYTFLEHELGMQE